MPRALNKLRKFALAVLAFGVILSGIESNAAAHDAEHHHEATAEAHEGSEPGKAPTSSCHGVLLCHAAAVPGAGDLSHPDATRGLRHRRHGDSLSHLVHPVFDPPPPRLAV